MPELGTALGCRVQLRFGKSSSQPYFDAISFINGVAQLQDFRAVFLEREAVIISSLSTRVQHLPWCPIDTQHERLDW